MRPVLASALLAASLLVLPACETFSGGNDDSNSNRQNAHLGQLDGNWRLTHINGNAVSVPNDAQNPTIRFSNGSVSGNSGINSMNATYTTQSRYSDNINFSAFNSTKMAGGTDAMDLERRFSDALNRVDTVRVDGDKLVMKDGDTQVLRFTRTN